MREGEFIVTTSIPPGPLPQVTQANTNQARSVQALQSRLPAERLRFRKEADDDFGVDAWIEAISDGRATNLRAHAQLKSVERSDANADGSISVSVPTYNLNYMLNGPLPIYVLYTADTGELRYAWAREEMRRIEVTSPNWAAQETVTLRFNDQLDDRALDTIWTRIINEGVLSRRIRELVGAAKGPTRLEVDPGAASVQGPEQAALFLKMSGVAITNAGFPDKVLELYAICATNERRSPAVLLACAYAECYRGRYAHAGSFLIDIRLAGGGLSEADATVLALVEAYYDFGTGRITRSEFLAREAAVVASGPEALQLEHRLRILQDALLQEVDGSNRGRIARDIVALAQSVESDGAASKERQVRFRLARLEAESDELMFRLLTEFHRSQASRRVALPFLPDTRVEDLRQWIADAKVLEVGLNSAVEDAKALRHPLLVAQSIAVQASVQFRVVATMHMIACVAARGDAEQMPERAVPVVRALIGQMRNARQIVSDAGVEDQEIHLALQLADMHAFIFEEAEAHRLAADAGRRAAILGYAHASERARRQLSSEWLWEDFAARVRQIADEDQDEALAAMSPDDVQRFARQAIRLFNLPEERFPAALKEVHTIRIASLERLTFCGNLRLLRNLSDTGSRETMWVRDPEWVCACERFGHRSAVPSREGEHLFPAFKAAYCATCSQRVPKRR